MSSHGKPTKALRSAAIQVIDRKLSGQRRLDAIAFIRTGARHIDQVRRLVERLDLLPDLKRECDVRAALTLPAILEIRRALAAGETQASIAKRHQVHSTVINKIATGKSYKGVGVTAASRPTEEPERTR